MGFVLKSKLPPRVIISKLDSPARDMPSPTRYGDKILVLEITGSRATTQGFQALEEWMPMAMFGR